MSADRQTVALYDAQAEAYAARFDKPEDARLDGFLDALPPGGRFLDLGCGPGRAAARAADRGFEVHATDASAAMVALAARHPAVRARQETFDELSQVAAYDGIWASFCLLHAPRAAMPGHLAAIHRALRSRGRLMLGLKTGEGAARDRLGRSYTYYARDEIAALLAAAGFDIVAEETGEETGFDGAVSPWIILLASLRD